MNTDTDPNGFRVDVAEGKYSVLHDGKGKMTALRYGEPWGRDLVGDNLVFHLAAELHETREVCRKMVHGLKQAQGYVETVSGKIMGEEDKSGVLEDINAALKLTLP